MTEAEWLACPDPKQMLTFVRGTVSERKHWLIACASCRLLWHRFSDWRIRRVVEFAERFADGQCSAEDLAAARAGVTTASKGGIGGFTHLLDETGSGRLAPYRCIDGLYCLTAGEPIQQHITPSYRDMEGWPLLRARIVQVIRDIAGDPFRPARVAPHWLAWNDRTVPTLAEMIYEERDFARLPILGDALEDTGCTDATILDHLRGPGPHVRGCWVIDLLLGKQ